jgi:hypothetical protein
MTDTIGIPGDRIRSLIERVKHIDEEINAPTTMVAEKASDIILGRPPLPPAEI